MKLREISQPTQLEVLLKVMGAAGLLEAAGDPKGPSMYIPKQSDPIQKMMAFLKQGKKLGFTTIDEVLRMENFNMIVTHMSNATGTDLTEGEERSDIRNLMIVKVKDYLESKGPGSYVSLEDLESDLYDYASQLDHDDLDSPEELRNFMHNPGEEASSAVTELLAGMYYVEFDDYITTEGKVIQGNFPGAPREIYQLHRSTQLPGNSKPTGLMIMQSPDLAVIQNKVKRLIQQDGIPADALTIQTKSGKTVPIQ
tara:strand:+ start:314 stop:1075 length:762 start_codon:yes stop_codon:yes gene_type:complete